jgi:CubicO group peptidase (beta-lactamase class C family)/beta-lactamase class A
MLRALVVLLLAASARGGDSLEARLLPLAKAHKGAVAVAVKNLKTGESYYLNADDPMPTASLIKLPVMVEAYQQVADGKLSLDTMVAVKKGDKVPGSGILTDHFSEGATFPLRDAIRLMIRYSDNTATNLVIDQVGITAVNGRMDALGFQNTRLNAKVFKGSTTTVSPERSKKYGLGSTTAREMVAMLEQIDAGKCVSPEASKAMLAHLKTCDHNEVFPRFLPPGTVIAHKTGSVNASRVDAGIIYPKAGDPVALCVLTDKNEDQRWSDENAAERLLADSAKAVYDYFQAKSPAAKLGRIDAAVEAAVARGDCPGAVVAVLHNDQVIYRKAFGQRSRVPQAEPMTADTIFDMASLTKPMATATSVHVLIERGKLNLSDPVAKHWPEFAANGKDAITVEMCLLHTTGLTADNAIGDYVGDRGQMLGRIAALKTEIPPGTRFRYSDVGFIVLGELVARLSGKPLDEFARENVFAPLKMKDSGYRPGDALAKRVAPTGKRGGASIRGEVHDPRASALGGVAGHAGLFSTADDTIRYCRMLLNGGELDGARVLSAESVKRFVEPAEVPAGKDGKADRPLLRSRGWDVDTSFSAPRGGAFARGAGYGHTGFTGTSVWVDPATRTAVVVLASRLHPDENLKASVTKLRQEVGTIVGEAVAGR